MRCAVCNKKLHGVTKEKLPKTKTRPTRPFAGVLCHSCIESLEKYVTRLRTGMIKKDEVPVKYKKYVSQVLRE